MHSIYFDSRREVKTSGTKRILTCKFVCLICVIASVCFVLFVLAKNNTFSKTLQNEDTMFCVKSDE